MIYIVRLRGYGQVTAAAYGVADAEHLVETEIAKCWPDARVRVLEVARPSKTRRVVEEFSLTYRIEGALTVDASTVEEASRQAYRTARELLASTRYSRTRWDTLGTPRPA